MIYGLYENRGFISSSDMLIKNGKEINDLELCQYSKEIRA